MSNLLSTISLVRLFDNFLNYFIVNKSAFFKETIKLARVEDETQVSRMTQCEEDHFEMLVRASNIVRNFDIISTIGI